MKKRLVSLLLAVLMLAAMVPAAFAADYTFTDRNGDEVLVPDGAWAARVVSFEPGDPWTSHDKFKDPEKVLGVSDWNGKTWTQSEGDMCLGAGGVLVLEFNVNIFDGPGDDIYVFEVGDDVEATKVEVSSDLKTWYEAGVAEGKTAGVDLNGKVPEGSRFRYVRLTDQKEHPNGEWPGADIDAVAGLNIKVISSAWAETELEKAEEYDLIPDVLQGVDYSKPITRLEFAAVAVKTYENMAGTKALPAVVNPFTDCSDTEVLKAYNLGVVNGISDTSFAPDELLSREQAAAMLTRVFKRATIPGWTLDNDAAYPLEFTYPAAFADDAHISAYAKESVYFMAANSIINGMEDNKFAPKNTTSAEEAQHYANATREQALAIAVRMVDNLK